MRRGRESTIKRDHVRVEKGTCRTVRRLRIRHTNGMPCDRKMRQRGLPRARKAADSKQRHRRPPARPGTQQNLKSQNHSWNGSALANRRPNSFFPRSPLTVPVSWSAALARDNSAHRASQSAGPAVCGALDCVLDACERTGAGAIYRDALYFSRVTR